MQNTWNSEDAAKAKGDPLPLRVYATSLLNVNAPDLEVFATVKSDLPDIFGTERTLLFLAHGSKLIALENDRLTRLGKLGSLAPEELEAQLALCGELPMTQAPTPDSILHASIPARFVDQTRTAATLALANNSKSVELAGELFGNRVAVVESGDALAIAETVGNNALDGILVPDKGLITFSDKAETCYQRTIALNSAASEYFESKSIPGPSASDEIVPTIDIATLRQSVSNIQGHATIAIHDDSPIARQFSRNPSAASLGAVTDGNHEQSLSDKPSTHIVSWPDRGLFSFGRSPYTASAIARFATHASEAAHLADATGAWNGATSATPAECGTTDRPLQGKIALVSGSAAGIGLATATTLAEAGACVIGADINPEIEAIMEEIGALGVTVDLTEESQIEGLIERIVRSYGGLDIVVSNAGIFTAGAYIEDMDPKNWDRSLAVNLTSHQVLLKRAIPFVKIGIDPTIIIIGSRNVNAPGAGAASYSCAKAALTQLCRVAALELAPDGVRVNIIHPDAVFDTKLWTKEALERSAERYGITVEQYKKRNLMKTEITSRSVGNTVVALASDAFAKTTGAQIPVDGGNDRII